MRIAQVAPLYESVPPRLYGGTERVVSYLTEELVNMGHEVTLFASGDSHTRARLVAACPQSLWRDENCRETLPHHVRLMQLVFEDVSRFDVIHFHTDYLHFPLVRLCPCRSITTIHGKLHGPDLKALFDDYREIPLVSICDNQRQPIPEANWRATVYHGLPGNQHTFRNRADGYLVGTTSIVQPRKRIPPGHRGISGDMKGTRVFIVIAAVAVVLTGCDKKGDSIGYAERKDAAQGVAAPSITETKAIAEEGFIYGLPIVMNYAVMYEFCLNKNSGQYKGPFNEIFNEHRVFTYKDTAVVTPNSDTPYSMLWVDLRAEPMVISVPAVAKHRYYSVQLIDGNTYNYGYIGSRATGSDPGDYLVVGPDWKGETPAGIKKVFSSTTPFSLAVFRTQLFNPGDMPNVEKVQAGYKAEPLSAFLKQSAPPAAPKIDFLRAAYQRGDF